MSSKQTYHPCTSNGITDKHHTYHNTKPRDAAKKHAKTLNKTLNKKSGVLHLMNVTRNSKKKNKIYTYSYTVRTLNNAEKNSSSFTRDNVIIIPKKEVTVERV